VFLFEGGLILELFEGIYNLKGLMEVMLFEVNLFEEDRGG
jgi:hypothetical protein